MSGQCCVEILYHIVNTLKSEDGELAELRHATSVLDHLSGLVLRLRNMRTSHQSRADYFDAIQSVWDLVYTEIQENEYKYPMTHSICYRLLQSNIFEVARYGNTGGTHGDLSETRLHLIRVVAHLLEQELYRINMVQTGGLTPFPVSIPEGVSEGCAVLLNSNDLSPWNIYNAWCTLFTYIGVSDITDRECLLMCSGILLGPIFRSVQIRMSTDRNADERDIRRVMGAIR
jgi:hypothetical protein